MQFRSQSLVLFLALFSTSILASPVPAEVAERNYDSTPSNYDSSYGSHAPTDYNSPPTSYDDPPAKTHTNNRHRQKSSGKSSKKSSKKTSGESTDKSTEGSLINISPDIDIDDICIGLGVCNPVNVNEHGIQTVDQ